MTIRGSDFPVEDPLVQIADRRATVVFAAADRIVVEVPADLDGGSLPVRIDGNHGQTIFLQVGRATATGLHQVDNPAFDADGNLFVTYSGSRGQESPVSIFRVTPAGAREPFASGIVNATSLVFGPDGKLYVSSRFEGVVYRVNADGTYEQVASDLGVACGLAFDQEGSMYVGDRSGTIFRVRDGRTEPFASVPASVAAFHLAMSPEGDLFVSGPTLASYDQVFRIGRDGQVRAVPASFGRPQGLAFSPDGALHVVDALAGASGLFRFRDVDSPPDRVVSGSGLIGVTFGPADELVLATHDTVYRW